MVEDSNGKNVNDVFINSTTETPLQESIPDSCKFLRSTSIASSEDDVKFVIKDPVSNTVQINKSAYLKLQHHSGGDPHRPLNRIKERFSIELENDIINGLKHSNAIKPDHHSLLGDKSQHLSNKQVKLNRSESSSSKQSDEWEFTIPIIRRASSVETVENLKNILDEFTRVDNTMEEKGKEKKRSAFKKLFFGGLFSKDKKKSLISNKETIYVDNATNETQVFNRQSSCRHTGTGDVQIKNIDINRSRSFVGNELNSKYANMHICDLNKDSSNLQKDNLQAYSLNASHNNKYLNTNMVEDNKHHPRGKVFPESNRNYPRSFSNSYKRDTPPRAEETKQNIKLVSPKASIPINSGRPLPNPYQPSLNVASESKDFNVNVHNLNKTVPKPYFDETYGTVFDCVTNTREAQARPVESSKLKLPPNRQIVNLEHRVKSPLPYYKVSTEKLIATELLKNKPKSPLTIKRTENCENLYDSKSTIDTSKQKPPRKPMPHEKHMSQAQASSLQSIELRHRSLSPLTSIRSSTPVDQQSVSSIKSSPQKDEMRRSVEAYCWREIKKIKEQEQVDLATYQQYYDQGRRGHRSCSLPRDFSRGDPVIVRGASGNSYVLQNNVLVPESRASLSQFPTQVQSRNFVRNSPQRSTVTGSQSDSISRPIFKRGSLTTPCPDDENPQYKKVSFSNHNKPEQSWPTRAGYMHSPPQRRLTDVDLDDDVFLPEELYGNTNKPAVNYRPEPTYHNESSSGYRSQGFYVTKKDMINENAQKNRKPINNGDLVSYHSTNLTRHGSIVIPNNSYSEYGYTGGRRMSFDSINVRNDHYISNGTNSRQVSYVIPHNRPYMEPYYANQVYQENPYGYRQRQVAVNNKVCDFYGQIHDEGQYGKVRGSGIVMGKLSRPPVPKPSLKEFQHYDGNPRNIPSRNISQERYQEMYKEMSLDRPLPPVPSHDSHYFRRK